MALSSVIRRWHFRDHLPIREIVRRTGLSRNTIRKYLQSDTVDPRFKVPERPSKLDPFAERLSAEPMPLHFSGASPLGALRNFLQAF